MKKVFKKLTASAVVLGLLFSAVLGTADYFTPDSYTIVKGGSLSWDAGAFSFAKDGAAEVSTSIHGQYPENLFRKTDAVQGDPA